MSTTPSRSASELTTRREFVKGVAAAGTVVAIASAASIAGEALPAPLQKAGAAGSAAPVVSFFMDQPYLDVSGLAVPYRPPAGMRSAQPLAQMSDETFRRCVYGA